MSVSERGTVLERREEESSSLDISVLSRRLDKLYAERSIWNRIAIWCLQALAK